MDIEIQTTKLEAAVGWRSCVGIVRREYPLSFGNYFSLRNGPRILNFWAENLEEAAKRFLPDGLVEVRVWHWVEEPYGERRVAIILDERIPSDWYHNNLCFTGYGLPPVEVGRQIYDLLGDPNYEFERFIDPQMYYAKRGQRYLSKGGVSWRLGDDAATLIAELENDRAEQNKEKK